MRGQLGVAVVGGGAFGATAAIELARNGHRVDLFERLDDLLLAASGINQYRLHRGYHYPRSLATAVECRASELMFRHAFPSAVVGDAEHFYAVAARDSRTSPDEYLRFCDRARLEYQPTTLDLLQPGSVDLVVRVEETMFDPAAMRRLLWEQLRAAGVRVHLGTEATAELIAPYDLAVVAGYSDVNVLGGGGATAPSYQFEVCEKPVVRLPARYAGHSVVVMDGPFMCVDPLAGTDLFVLGNVVHAIHHASIGQRPEVPDELRPLLNRGIVPAPSLTKIGEFIESGHEFFRDFKQAEHVGSMFTIRAVLPGVDHTDARPTLVTRVSDRMISVFSGKIDTCVRAAQRIGEIADELVSGKPARDADDSFGQLRAG